MRCCLRRMVRRVDSRRMRREHRLDAHRGDQTQRLSSDSPSSRCRRAMQSAMPPGCAGARIVEVLAAAAHPVHLLGRVDRLKPERKGARQVGGGRRFPARRAALQRRVPVAAACPRPGPRAARSPRAVAFHEFKELLAALIAQRLADQEPERVHVLAQLEVLDGKLNALGDTCASPAIMSNFSHGAARADGATMPRRPERRRLSAGSAAPWCRSSRSSSARAGRRFCMMRWAVLVGALAPAACGSSRRPAAARCPRSGADRLKRASRCIRSRSQISGADSSWPSPAPTFASSAHLRPIKRMTKRALSTRPRSLKNSISD